MQTIDMLIQAAWIIPVEPTNTIYEQYSIAVDKGSIIDILPTHDVPSRFRAHVTHRLTNHVLIPGFINAHTHAAMSLMRGFADDLPLHDWLQKRIWVAEMACISPEFVADGTRLAIAEMLRGGTTCFNDMYFFPDIAAEISAEIGIRAQIGLIVIDFPSPWASNLDEYLHKGAQVHEKFAENPLIRTALAPHAPYTVSDTAFKRTIDMAQQLNLPIHIHVHETASEINDAITQTGERPLARLARLGLLHSRLQAVHLTQLNQEDIQQLATARAHAIHCPESNMKLASGICPVPALLDAGINVALGTDGSASNNDLDMLGEMRSAAFLAKVSSNNAATLPAATVLQMATLNGAKALGIDHLTGSLQIGKSADMVAVDLSAIELQPVYNPLSHLIYSVNRDQVTDVWIAGKHLVKGRLLTTFDLHELQKRALFWRQKIAATVN